MLAVLRSLRLGVINFFGITIPGILLITFIFFGLILPTLTFAFNYIYILNINNYNSVDSLTKFRKLLSYLAKFDFYIVLYIIILAYVIGYIIRLSSIDELDNKSANKVKKEMEKKKENSEVEVWPFDYENSDKFPYSKYRIYLHARGLDDLKKYVFWGKPTDDEDKEDATFVKKRSKTHINDMKLKIFASKYDKLISIVESNEAHVRLLFGTWYCAKAVWFVLLGVIISGIGIFIDFKIHSTVLHSTFTHFYLIYLVCNFSIMLSIFWGKSIIEDLFHYQRVRELTQIVMCFKEMENSVLKEESIPINDIINSLIRPKNN